MLITISVLLLSLAWLLYETDLLRVQLPVGKLKPVIPKYARYEVYHVLKNRKVKRTENPVFTGQNFADDTHPNDVKTYTIVLSPGIEPMCGYDWLNNHCADMVDYELKTELTVGKARFNMTIKDQSIIPNVIKVMHMTKQEKMNL